METKAEVEHTPTPWHLRNDSTEIAYSDGELVSYIAGVHVATICPEHGTPESNAVFIVKACNAYDGMLEQHSRDSRTLAEYAKEKNDLREQVRADQKKIKALIEVSREALILLDEEMPMEIRMGMQTPKKEIIKKLRQAIQQGESV